MTRATAAEFLPIVKAMSEGKTIQILRFGNWEDLGLSEHLPEDVPPFSVRVKPELKECWAVFGPHGGLITAYSQEEDATKSREGRPTWTVHHMREVMEDQP